MDTTQLIQALREFSTTELCDGMTEFRVLDPAIHGMAARRKIVGPVFPVEIPGGVSGIIPDALLEIRPGQVLVIAAQGYCHKTCWGDYRSFCAAIQQVEGVVIDGAFRDLEGCEEAGVPIYARTVVPRAGKKGPRWQDQRASLSGQCTSQSWRYHCGRCGWCRGDRSRRGRKYYGTCPGKISAGSFCNSAHE